MGPIRSLVISRPDRIGDVIVSSSCLQAVSTHFPKAKIYWLIDKNLHCLFYNHPAIEACLSVPQNDGEGTALAKQLEALNVDVIVHLERNTLIEEAGHQAGITRQIGHIHKSSKHLSEALPNKKKKGQKHEGLYNFDLLKPLGITPPDRLTPALSFDETETISARTLLEKYTITSPFAVFHLAVFGDKPRLPAALTSQCARWLIEKKGMTVVIVGLKANEPEEQAFLAQLTDHSSKVISLCAKTSIPQLAWIYEQAAFALSRDTGPAHLAAAMNCPTLTIVAEPNAVKSSKRWHPLGNDSHVLENKIKQRFWENDQAFAQRNFSMIKIKNLLNQIETMVEKKT